ncbi:MAG: ATP-binding cassette domain-containing protein [Phycisphaerales bacterium]|nr:ATP-binding cassette domain-containing protein [Phycisphaerae bacterium]NNF44512.1 ATP-binding cassette domain-containing protein [Phycisphaerales bacterium]NNM24401.1 ATP-binding cassette domain-containing protein [Phycisphaerales bacterium]
MQPFVTEPAIAIQGVNKRFGATHAVRDLDLTVPAGSLCGFLGPNGAGKSTTIRMIMSIIYPDDGEIRVLGSTAMANKDRIGYLPEERGLYRKMRVGDFLHYIARLKGVTRPDLDAHITAWLERIELPGVARRRCQELSKGMQQKVQFLAAIIHDPDLVILDEPFSGLDPVNAELLNTLIRELQETGRTIIFSTHVLHQAEEICDRIFLINHGVKMLDAPLEEIRRRFDPRTIEVDPVTPVNGGLEIPGVNGIAARGSNAVELHLDDDADPHAVMRATLERVPARSIRLRRPTLQEIFVETVRAGEGEAAAAQAEEALSHAP